MIILRALKMGISLEGLDNITLGFILDLVEQNNLEAREDDEIEATIEMLDRF